MSSSGDLMGSSLQYVGRINFSSFCQSVEAQLAFYLLPASGPMNLLEFDVGSVPGRRLCGSCLLSNKDGQMV